jgi:hypothetical protein
MLQTMPMLWGRVGRAAGRLVEQQSKQRPLRQPQQEQPRQQEQQQGISVCGCVHALT